ncbi:hypothetical protein PCASD_24423 [Puccinia coronata f. sp. avenae]|uniref:Uncharacterized protein n=1 Tax=Puccinia coronata f. sp. avenae TaxID=200324 RepID=A0A2N5TI73_9BASI|nr:hypothetical protein PCASD_24423 [Puccinia coronata f. sp. avenae]
MKKKMDGSEAILVEDFLIKDILEDAQPDDVHARLRSEMHKFTDKLMSQGSEGRDGDGGDKTVEKRATISRSVFLMEQDNSQWAWKQVDTRKAMLTQAIQALVHQGTIIILLRNKCRFTLPNIHSLGPKILQIIAQHQQQYPALALVNTTHIRAVLARDQLLTCAVPLPSYGLLSINHLGGGGQQPAGSSTSTSGQGIGGYFSGSPSQLASPLSGPS